MRDPDQQPYPPPRERPSDELVLAAIERGVCHEPRGLAAISLGTLFEHLCVARRSAAARHVRARLAVLHAAGWLSRSRRHGVYTWELSAAGRRYLARARRGGRVRALPEAPQHRAWRTARATAAQELDRFRLRLQAGLDRADALLAADPAAPSDAWFALGEELRRACWRVGSASHCLHEWAEPDDARADVDEHTEASDERLEPTARAGARARRLGRRNVRLW